jgi:hypothetical protein
MKINLADGGWKVIHTYSRADAIADGTLVEVPEDLARNAGFRCHVAATRAVWEDCVAWSDADNRRKGTLQDETGRLWDVLWMASRRIGMTRLCDQDNVTFQVYRVRRAGRGVMPRPVTLVARTGAGDDDGQVITITQPGED